jgi:hypothetical protein
MAPTVPYGDRNTAPDIQAKRFTNKDWHGFQMGSTDNPEDFYDFFMPFQQLSVESSVSLYVKRAFY